MNYRVSLMALIFATLNLPIQFAASATEEYSPNPIDTEKYLQEFHSNPKRVMNSPLLKRDEHGHVVTNASSPFDQAGVSAADRLKARDEVRARICRASGRDCDPAKPGRRSGFAVADEKNQITRFLYNPTFSRNLLEMEKANLLQVTLQEAPWSDSFWPTRKGLIARRWRDASFPNSNTWADNYGYVQFWPPFIISTDTMAPSEKYDLLVGDYAFPLTDAMWKDGKYYADQGRNVPGWAGLCHGWAPAAIMSKNPMRSVTVRSETGRDITFYPSDIKALASLAWGEAPGKFNFVGERCKVNDPKEDAVGRVIDPNCFDVNPATWHMGVVHQLGVEKRSFVFDATYDYQVWNYPVYAYQYHYFNPQTLATSKKLASAMVKVGDFTIDKFKTYRSPEARYIVGISMDVSYAIPTQPSSKPVKKSTFHTVRYVYDLELDANGTIVGGEWYSNFHPDFIWNPLPESHPLSDAEKALPAPVAWDGQSAIPRELLDAARTASPKKQPLAAIVEALVRMASEPEAGTAPGSSTP